MSRFASHEADAYESLLEHNAQDCNSSAVQHVTPRARQSMMDRIAPRPGTTVCDPVRGTGGSLSTAHHNRTQRYPNLTFAKLEPDLRGWEEPARDPEVEDVAIDAATFDLNAVSTNVSIAPDTRILLEIVDCVAADGAVVGRAMARIRRMMIEASQVSATWRRAGAGGLSG